MARLQILELPEGASDDRPPFVLVIDQAEPATDPIGDEKPLPLPDGLAEKIGARAVLVFNETIDIPANPPFAGLCANPGPRGEATGPCLEPLGHDMHRDGHGASWPAHSGHTEERLQLARQALLADGYFTADDIGDDIAPRLTEWLSHHRQETENFKGRANAMEIRLRVQKAALTDALSMDRLRDWDDIVNAARGLRKERDHLHAGTDAVRSLHRAVESPEYANIMCAHCSSYDAPVAHPCVTVKALDAKPDEGGPERGPA